MSILLSFFQYDCDVKQKFRKKKKSKAKFGGGANIVCY